MNTFKKGEKVTYTGDPRRFRNTSGKYRMLWPGATGTVRVGASRYYNASTVVVEFMTGEGAADFMLDASRLALEVFTPTDASPAPVGIWQTIKELVYG
jgi:hypothetical protein